MRMASVSRTEAHMARPSTMASMTVSIRSSSTTRSAASRAGRRAAAAERDPRVREPDSRSVVGTVSRHGDRAADSLVGADDAHLVRRRDPGEHGCAVQHCVKPIVVPRVKFGSGEHRDAI